MYDSAVVEFSQGYRLDSLNQDNAFYFANALLASDKANEAASLFFRLQQDESGRFQIPSKWFLGLCYLKMKDVDHASRVFKEIALQKNSYSDKAKKILKKLN